MKKNSKVIIQADGKSMSGFNDNLESNYEALKCECKSDFTSEKICAYYRTFCKQKGDLSGYVIRFFLSFTGILVDERRCFRYALYE